MFHYLHPIVKESGMILLQTIPDTIDIEIFKKTLLDGFKDIVSVHDLHIWQLSGNQYVSTVHIIFDNPKVGCVDLFRNYNVFYFKLYSLYLIAGVLKDPQ